MTKKYLAIFLFFSLLFSNNIALAQNESSVILKVPYTSEIPTGSWTKPWNNACEEASIVMVKGYYFGYESTTKKIAAADMMPLFKIEDKIFGSNADTTAAQTAKLINNYTDITAEVKENPTVDEIKNELSAGHPVIAMLNMKNIINKNHRFRAGGSYYHVLVIIGFDDSTKEFVTNDNGNAINGADYRFKYDDIMDNLHDFNQKTRRTDGPARVLFTDSKILYKAKNDPKVYLIKHDVKYHIASSDIFKKHGWQWKKIKIVEQKKLDNLITGDPISS
ncbi:MAG: C39 family peptidase [Candidatus Magasanikbacteria bacterium]|jgi:hypothetical protein